MSTNGHSETSPPPSAQEVEEIVNAAAAVRDLRTQLARRIVGQQGVVTEVLAALLSEGHCLMVGVPGLAKTLLISSIGELLSLKFNRIQFTPDLMPSDVTGSTMIAADATGRRSFQFVRGPIFANLILADEINRTPPKTQAALMEAMEERQVSSGGEHMKLERPFFVLATQNPIEQQGTYPLPVSQLDRFLFNVTIDYPHVDEEFHIVLRTTSTYAAAINRSFAADDVRSWIRLTRRIEVPQEVVAYASQITRATRPDDEAAPAFVREHVRFGAGPRGTQSLLSGARALALMEGRPIVHFRDVDAVALPTLRHRLILSYHARAEGIAPDDAVRSVLASLATRYAEIVPAAPVGARAERS